MIYARQIPWALSLILAAVYLAFPQESKKEADPLPSQEIQNIISEAHSLDAEYAIDILLKIVRSEKLPNKKWQKRLLTEAYRRLDEIQEPNPQQLVLAGISVDNRQVRLSEAFEKRLDALSLRSEILRQMLRVDPKEARRIAFYTGFFPKTKTISCEDALSDVFEPFYEIIAEISKTSFSSAEKKNHTRLTALIPFIESIANLAQIAPAGKMILAIDAEKAELNQLLLAYSSSIKNLQPSDREFSGFLWSYDWIRQFMSVLKVCEKQDIQCSILKDNIRGFIVKSFRSERCADNTETYKEYTPGMLKFLNSAIFTNNPLRADDLKPSSIGDSAKLDPYGESAGAKGIAEKYRVLRWKNPTDASEYPEEEKLASEWLEKFERLFDEINSWNGEDEKSPMLFFHQKCIFYKILHELAPSGNFQARVLRAFGNFLSNDSIRKESRIEWFFWMEDYMRIVERNADLKPELLDNAKNPIIRLYASLKKSAIN